MGGASLALGQGGGTASSNVSERAKAMSSERGRAVSAERGKALTTERGRVISGERGQAFAAERGRAISGGRGQALTAERGLAMTGRGPRTADQQGQFRSRPETSGLANAYGSARSADVGLMRSNACACTTSYRLARISRELRTLPPGLSELTPSSQEVCGSPPFRKRSA